MGTPMDSVGHELQYMVHFPYLDINVLDGIRQSILHELYNGKWHYCVTETKTNWIFHIHQNRAKHGAFHWFKHVQGSMFDPLVNIHKNS